MLEPPAAPAPGSATDVDPAAALAHLLSVVDGPCAESMGLAEGVGGLVEVRRIEAWLTWAKHRLAGSTMRAAERQQERWVDSHPTTGDDLADGERGEGLARAERLALAERAGVAEIACALRVGETAAQGLVLRAELFGGHLAATDAALRAGHVTGAAAVEIAAGVAGYVGELPTATDEAMVDALTRAVQGTELDLLGEATRGMTTGEIRNRARLLREQCHPVPFPERFAAARAGRYVRVRADQDGMAQLSALLPTAVARRIDGRLSTIARQLQQAEREESIAGETRAEAIGQYPPTIGQLRADVLADLLGGLTGRRSVVPVLPGESPTGDVLDSDGHLTQLMDDGRAPQLVVTVPAVTLLGAEDPAWLGRLGPIAAADARYLASLATSLSMVITARGTGEATGPPVAAGPPGPEPPAAGPPPAEGSSMWTTPVVVPVAVTNGQQYRVPAALRRALAVRDGTCRFPGCRRLADRCDVDHVPAWADGGASEVVNLAQLCRRHHVLKHHTGWSVQVEPLDPLRAPARSDGSIVTGCGFGDSVDPRRDSVDRTGDPVDRLGDPVDLLRDPADPGRVGEADLPGPERARWFEMLESHTVAARLRWTSPAGRQYVTDPERPPF
ncbi:hypothetical protein BKD30_09305 [Tersicoccus phoenicis]|uniref:HNH nuclease domain-containing protein n=1 Tax=Tersicoccus phoenicis TaxID=554083 RepID=A0A1R1L989_9MICC|nr:hypothetical protein BKD30_09305 [Tersicoccus phoenicis]